MPIPAQFRTTCDIYRNGNNPPAAADIASVPCILIPSFEEGREHGEGESVNLRYTHKLLIGETVDIRDGCAEFVVTVGNRDTVYIPNNLSIGYVVVFVEKADIGEATVHKRAYLNRKSVTWPFPNIQILPVGGQGVLGGGAATIVLRPATHFSITGSGGVLGGGASAYSGPWSYILDATSSQGPFTAVVGSWSSGNGFIDGQVLNTGEYYCFAEARLTLATPVEMHKIEMVYDVSGASFDHPNDDWISHTDDSVPNRIITRTSANGTNITLTYTGSITKSVIDFVATGSEDVSIAVNPDVKIKTIRIYGNGTKPPELV